MKKILAFLIAVVMVVGLCSCAATSDKTTDTTAADTTGTVAETSSVTTVSEGELHMATNAAFPPYESVDDDGNYTGIDVEIATLIAEKLGLTLVIDNMDFDSVILSVQSGKSDIAMAGLTVTDERKESIDFTDSYATGIQSIIVADGSAIATADDLQNADKIGVQRGTTGDIYCTDDFGSEHVTEYDNGALAVEGLKAGKVDAVVIDNEPAKAFVAANDGLVLLDTDYTEEDYAIGVSKDNPDLTEAINSALVELIDDGSVQQIIDKYIYSEE